MELPADDGRNIPHVLVDGPWDPRDDWNLAFRLEIMDDSSIDTDSNNSENQRQREIEEQKQEVISLSSGSVDEPLFQEQSVFDVSTEGQTSELTDRVSEASAVSSDDGFLCQFCGEPSGCDCVERGYKM